jgi:predicted transcriptional regulator
VHLVLSPKETFRDKSFHADTSPAPRPAPRPAANGMRNGAKTEVGERFAMLNTFADCALAELSRAEIAVWLVLFRDTREGTARASYDDLARRAGCDRRNVGRALRRLEERGLLSVVHRGGMRRGVSRYWCPRTTEREITLGTLASLLTGTFGASFWGRWRPLSHRDH